MNSLTISLTDDQLMVIGNELERLFIFQDRPLSKEKKAILVQEIGTWSMPAGAIISGIRSLMAEDLKSVKLAIIKTVSRQFMVPEAIEKKECHFCWGGGVILMKDDKHYEFALSCRCSNAPKGLSIWNGEETQFSRGRWLTLRHADILQKEVTRN